MTTFRLSFAGLWLLLCAVPCSADSTQPVAQAMTTAAQQFLATLSPEQVQQVQLDFDNPARLDWHNIPKPQRKGMQVREMNPEQRKLCHQLLQAALSKVGYEKATRIMSLENNLFVGEQGLKNAPLRDPYRYFLTIFGKPAADSSWGWSFEGHHFSLNFVIRDGSVVSETPSFWGANPATVKVFVEKGPQVGTRTLAEEEQHAFDLLHELTPEQRNKAIIAKQAPKDYRNAGKPEPPHAAPEGLPATEMTAEQQQTLWSLLETYNSHLAPTIAEKRLQAIKDAGWKDVYFAWMGATEPGIGHAYRIQGPTFVLELVNIQADPQGNPANHIHSVWRSLPHDFGLTAK